MCFYVFLSKQHSLATGYLGQQNSTKVPRFNGLHVRQGVSNLSHTIDNARNVFLPYNITVFDAIPIYLTVFAGHVLEPGQSEIGRVLVTLGNAVHQI